MRDRAEVVAGLSPGRNHAPASARVRLFLGAMAAAILALALMAPLAAASKSIVGLIGSQGFGENRSLGGQFNSVQGVAVNSSSGDVYVADRFKGRVQRFDSQGNFISTWGIDTIQAGRPGDLGSNAFEVCTVAADCKDGVESAIGGVNPGGQLTPDGISVDQTTGNVYVHNAEYLRVEVFSASGTFIRAFGEDVVRAGKPGNANETQAITVSATAGQFRLGFGAGGPGVSETADLAFDASASTVEAALNALTNISSGGGSVTVSGGPGSETGATPYVVSFDGGARAGTDVAQLTAAPGTIPISGGNPASGVSVATTNSGATGFEVCAVAADCKAGQSAGAAGAFASPFSAGSMSTVPSGGTAPNAGNVLVADRGNRRVSEYTAQGAFVRSFGFDVVQSGPGNTASGEFEVCKAGVDACKEAAAGGPGIGQFGTNSLKRVVEDSNGTIYTAEYAIGGNFRVQRFTLPGNAVTPQGVFAESILGGTSEETSAIGLAIDGSGNLIATKVFPAGATPSCLISGGLPSVGNEERILELSPAGTLLDTHLACAGIIDFGGEALAVDPDSGKILFGSSLPFNTEQVYVLDNVNAPASAIDPITDFDAFSAALAGQVNPEGSPTNCRFDYLAKAKFDQNVSEAKDGFLGSVKVPCGSSPGAGTSPVAVAIEASPLKPNTTYKARIVAYKAPFGDIATASSVEEFTTESEPPPTVITGAVAPRGTSTARLSGLVNANDLATEVHFEYGTAGPCSANPCQSTEVEDAGIAFIPPGQPFTTVNAELKGLKAGTTYHYRFVGISAAGTSEGADRTFSTRTVAEMSLPAPRGAELVNSPDKGNQDVQEVYTSLLGTITPTGDRAFWSVRAGAPGGFNGTTNGFLAKRGPTGWSSRPIAPPPAQQLGGGDFAYKIDAITPDLTHFFATVGENNLGPLDPVLARLDEIGGQSFLVKCPPVCTGDLGGGRSGNLKVTADGAHAIFTDIGAEPVNRLVDVGAATVGPPEVSPQVVSIMPDGSPNACNFVQASAFEIATTDASRIYFEFRPNSSAPGCSAPFALYVRNREANGGAGETTLIDAGSGADVELLKASADGRSAFFTTISKLDPADTNSDRDIYRWDEAAEASSCLTCVVAKAKVLMGTLQTSAVAVSDDLSHIYFQSKEQLVTGQGRAGEANLYVLHEGKVGFVADPDAVRVLEGSSLSEDGEALIFSIPSDLTGVNQELTADPIANCGEEKCPQLYRYDDSDGSLECVSCRHGATTTHAVSSSPAIFVLSADGSTAVFKTAEPLVPADVNGEADIYEWRGGAVRLITDGLSDFPEGDASPLVAAVDADGSDVFFTVAAPGGLTGFEHDGVANFYDARIGGGFVPPSPPPHCEGDDCQGPLGAPPPAPNSSSASYAGRGNLPPQRSRRRPCARKRGKAKQRCVKRQRQRQRAQKGAGR